MGLNYFIYNILPKRLSLEIKKLYSETKNAQCMLNVNCCYKTILLQLKECIICMCGVLERVYSILFSGNLSSTQFVSVAVLQFFYIDSSIAGNICCGSMFKSV